MPDRTFKVELSRDANGFVVARAMDQLSGQEIDNFVAQTKEMALLGLRQQLQAKFQKPEETTLTINVPAETPPSG